MTKYEKIKIILLTTFGIILLLVLYNFSENGRYTVCEESHIILDSKKGTVYMMLSEKYFKITDFTEFENTKD